MKYSNIISDFTWSYSRINQFEMCPYAFLLNYIKHTPKKPLFFSDYGSFIHKLIEQYLNGELKKDELAGEYLVLQLADKALAHSRRLYLVEIHRCLLA